MIDILTPMKDGKTIALQSDDYSSSAVERFITGGPHFRKGMRVTRTKLARSTASRSWFRIRHAHGRNGHRSSTRQIQRMRSCSC